MGQNNIHSDLEAIGRLSADALRHGDVLKSGIKKVEGMLASVTFDCWLPSLARIETPNGVEYRLGFAVPPIPQTENDRKRTFVVARRVVQAAAPTLVAFSEPMQLVMLGSHIIIPASERIPELVSKIRAEVEELAMAAALDAMSSLVPELAEGQKKTGKKKGREGFATD